jgi:hypothetical protein
VSSSTIESLKNRSTDERVRAVFVNSSGNGPVHFELSPHQFTRESGPKARVMPLDLPVHSAKFCLFDAQSSEYETHAFVRAFTHVDEGSIPRFRAKHRRTFALFTKKMERSNEQERIENDCFIRASRAAL